MTGVQTCALPISRSMRQSETCNGWGRDMFLVGCRSYGVCFVGLLIRDLALAGSRVLCTKRLGCCLYSQVRIFTFCQHSGFNLVNSTTPHAYDLRSQTYIQHQVVLGRTQGRITRSFCPSCAHERARSANNVIAVKSICTPLPLELRETLQVP